MNIDNAYIACLYGNNAEEFFILSPGERPGDRRGSYCGREVLLGRKSVEEGGAGLRGESRSCDCKHQKALWSCRSAGRRCHSFHKESIRDQDVSEPEAGKS